MNILNKIFPIFSKPKSSLELILEAIESAKLENKECLRVAFTNPDFELPVKVDLEFRNDTFLVSEYRIDYNYQIMVELEKLGYYACSREGNKTTELFSSLFIMVA